MGASHTLDPQPNGTVAGVSSWNWANTLHNVRAFRERVTSRTLRTEAEIRRWARGKADLSESTIIQAISHIRMTQGKAP